MELHHHFGLSFSGTPFESTDWMINRLKFPRHYFWHHFSRPFVKMKKIVIWMQLANYSRSNERRLTDTRKIKGTWFDFNQSIKPIWWDFFFPLKEGEEVIEFNFMREGTRKSKPRVIVVIVLLSCSCTTILPQEKIESSESGHFLSK